MVSQPNRFDDDDASQWSDEAMYDEQFEPVHYQGVASLPNTPMVDEVWVDLIDDTLNRFITQVDPAYLPYIPNLVAGALGYISQQDIDTSQLMEISLSLSEISPGVVELNLEVGVVGDALIHGATARTVMD